MTLTNAVISTKIAATATNTSSGGIDTPAENMSFAVDTQFADGSGSNQAKQIYSKRQTNLGTSATDTIRLDNGSISDGFGAALTFTAVKVIMIKNTGTVDITIAGANRSLPPTATPVTLTPGGVYLVVNPSAAGWVVGSGSTHTVVIVNTSGSTAAKYDLAVLGVV